MATVVHNEARPGESWIVEAGAHYDAEGLMYVKVTHLAASSGLRDSEWSHYPADAMDDDTREHLRITRYGAFHEHCEFLEGADCVCTEGWRD